MRRIAFIFIWIFLASMPFQDWQASTLVETSGTITRLMGIMAAIVGFASLMYDGRLRRIGNIHIILIVQIGWIFLGYLWSEHQGATFNRMITYGQLAIMIVLLTQFAQEKSESLDLTVAYTLGAVIVAGAVFRAWASGQVFSMWEERFTPFENDPNDSALAMAIAVPMAWNLVVRSKRLIWAIAGYAAIGAISIAIFLTASRGGLLALVAGIVVIPFGLARISNLKRATLAIAILVGTIISIQVVPRGVWARYESLGEILERSGRGGYKAELEGPNIRTIVWKQGLREWRSSPKNSAFGVGAGAFRRAVEPLYGEEMVAHSIFVSILVEQGLVGALLFLITLLLALGIVRRMPPDERVMWAGVLFVWIVGAAFLSWEHKKQTWMILTMIGARGCALPMWKGRRVSSVLFGSRWGWRMRRTHPVTPLQSLQSRSGSVRPDWH
jgi:O-antigen ligase